MLDLSCRGISAIPALRGVGQANSPGCRSGWTTVQRRTEAREAERSLKIQNLIDRFPVFADLGEEAREDLLPPVPAEFGRSRQEADPQGRPAGRGLLPVRGARQVRSARMEIELGPGDFFGEMALLSGARRSADVTALDFCELLMLTRRDFLLFLARYPGLRAGIEEVAASRLAMNESNSA